MDFQELKKLSIDQQIQWLNKNLTEGLTVAEIREILGIGEKALQKHVKSIAYKYDQKLKQYVLRDDKNNKSDSKQDKSIITAIQKDIKGVVTNQQDNRNTLELQLGNSDYNKFMHIMDTYEELQKQVQELIKKQEIEDNIIDVTPPKLEITPMKNKPISKTYKFDPDVIEDFTAFCNKHKNYKVQDIISKAIREFIDKY